MASTIQLVTYAVVTATSLFVGFRLGSSVTFPLVRTLDIAATVENDELDDIHPEYEQSIEIEGDGDLAAVQPGIFEPCKMILVVRYDLKMDAGTIAAQCCEATLACYKTLSVKNPKLVRHWEITGLRLQ
ncbi:hypothetical protein SISNIDRAFT_74688 [Sistotremastrum niveocremeum HHB9708]|uniref:peptidyl-tRNA hydrolase n=1 Tax=Sistotremastrum niveocremeum HHB9708 TaxID=1314777 RepID=A0A164UI62_9AGAM|nr:hypothetical protein SISNIDRAFT_74688 [Sistotremastrum niveocremeum HHB9708]